MRNFGKLGLTSLFLLKKMIRDICTKGRAQHLTDLLQNHKYDQKIHLQQKVQKYGKSKTGVKTAQKPLFKELRTILEKIGFQVLFCFFVRFLFSCHILSCFLRGPATQPLHSEGRRPEFV